MILQTPFGRRELRSASLYDGSDRIPRASRYGGSVGFSGERVNLQSATGLPAFMRAVRLLCETAGMLPLEVGRGRGGLFTVEESAPQWPLLHEQPNEDMSPMDCWAYVVASLLRGNAYVQKLKARGRVVELYPLDPGRVAPKVENGSIVFHVKDGNKTTVLTKADLIHIPGLLLDDPCVGVSLVQAFRNPLATHLARQRFEGRYLANDGTPSVVINHPDKNLSEEQRQALRDSYTAKHSGPDNAGRPAVMWGGVTLDKISVSLSDAQFVEAQNFAVQDIARMTGVPAGLLGDPEAPGSDSPEKENMRFLTYGLSPWLTRLESGLWMDDDLFPDKKLRPRFNADELLRVDFATRAAADHKLRQAGIATVNELRPHYGLGPHPDGDELQQTPVGGAPNVATEDNAA